MITVTTPPPLPMVRAGTLPDEAIYRDTGCEVSPSCLRCPLPVCRYDDPGYLARQRIAERQARVRELRVRGMSALAIAAELDVNTRSVHRDLALIGAGGG